MKESRTTSRRTICRPRGRSLREYDGMAFLCLLTHELLRFSSCLFGFRENRVPHLRGAGICDTLLAIPLEADVWFASSQGCVAWLVNVVKEGFASSSKGKAIKERQDAN